MICVGFLRGNPYYRNKEYHESTTTDDETTSSSKSEVRSSPAKEDVSGSKVGPKCINLKVVFLSALAYEHNLHETYFIKSKQITEFQDLSYTFFPLDMK